MPPRHRLAVLRQLPLEVCPDGAGEMAGEVRGVSVWLAERPPDVQEAHRTRIGEQGL